jgi:hypothetical protein
MDPIDLEKLTDHGRRASIYSIARFVGKYPWERTVVSMGCEYQCASQLLYLLCVFFFEATDGRHHVSTS